MKKFILSILAFLSPIMFTSCDCDIQRIINNLIVGGGEVSYTFDGTHYERNVSRMKCSYDIYEGSEQAIFVLSVMLSTSYNGPDMHSLCIRINTLTPLEPYKRYEFTPECSYEDFPYYGVVLGTRDCIGGWVEFQDIDYPTKPGYTDFGVKGTFEADFIKSDGSIQHLRQGTFNVVCTLFHVRPKQP